MEKEKKDIGFFQRYLSIWVALCMIAGVLLGRFLPVVLILVNIANKTVKWFPK